jgi:hypothetical protein
VSPEHLIIKLDMTWKFCLARCETSGVHSCVGMRLEVCVKAEIRVSVCNVPYPKYLERKIPSESFSIKCN